MGRQGGAGEQRAASRGHRGRGAGGGVTGAEIEIN